MDAKASPDLPTSLEEVSSDKLSNLDIVELEKQSLDDKKVSSEVDVEDKIDPNLVTWDGPNDTENPLNWSSKKKGLIILLVSMSTFTSAISSAIFAPGVPEIIIQFGITSGAVASFLVSIYVLGFALGPLALGPLSELYGRSIVYKITAILYTAFSIGCGECNSTGALFALRFLSGLSGSAALALGSGTVADLIPQEKRGKYMSTYVLGPILGPCLGPVIGGLLSEVSWRWTFRLCGMLAGIIGIMIWLFLDETYGVMVLKRKAKRLRKITGNENLYTAYDDVSLSAGQIFARTIIRPCKLVILSPIAGILSLYSAIAYGTLYLLFTTFTGNFETRYGFTTTTVGLSYLGLGLGTITSVMIIRTYSDRMLLYLASKTPNGEKKPEFRLPFVIILTPLVPIGLIIYGWTMQYNVHWIVPIIGTYIIGTGIIGAFFPVLSYLVDAYTIYAASAASACTMIRSIGGAFLPLCGDKLYATLGLGGGNTLLAGIIILLYPVPVILFFKGEKLRKAFTPKL